MNNGEPCRGISCSKILPVSDMVPARRVLRNPRARGWYCQRCAARMRAHLPRTRREPREVPKFRPKDRGTRA